MAQDGVFNAVISRVNLGLERGFLLDAWVHLDFGGSGQGFGGWVLGGTEDSAAGRPEGKNYAGIWIVGVLNAAGCTDWNDLPGQSVRVLRESGLLVSIGHIIHEDRWFRPSEAFAEAVANA